MKIDILFIDPVAAMPYTFESLEGAIGGSEAATIRLAEGFASKGHSVAVVEKYEMETYTSPNGVNYYKPYWANVLKPKNVIFLRCRGKWEMFPESNCFVWLHDACSETHNNPSNWVDSMIQHNVLAVCQSDWHKSNLLKTAPDLPVTRIYPPCDELCYQPAREYDKNQLVWLASPHKGLKDAIRVFQKIRQTAPEMKLAVFNPGYYEEDVGQYENVVFLPKKSKKVLRSVLAQSLCLFYPTQFEETFGCIAAEANALGVPLATYEVGALTESSIGPFMTSEDELIQKVLEWRNKGRPVVNGQDRFRFESIYPQWLKTLNL